MVDPSANKEIKQKYELQNQLLERQIQSIELRQQELQNYITTLNQTIAHMERTIIQEERKAPINFNRINGLRQGVSKNIELLVKLYDSYKEFENVKFRYYKEINSHSHNGIRLINIDLFKINNKFSDDSAQFTDVIRFMSKLIEQKTEPELNQMTSNVASSLADNSDYQL